MKKLLILGAALLGLCAVGHTARAGDDGPDYSYERRAPERAPDYYEPRTVYPRCYLPPPPPIFLPPLPRVVFYGRPHYHRHYYPYGYGYGYRPGLHIGIGF